MGDITTRASDVVAEVNNFYNRTLLYRAKAYFCHVNWAQIRDIPTKSGTDTIKFRRYGALAANTTALTEGVTPAGKKLSTTDITAQIQYYGDYVELTDKLQLETYDPILTETADILGDQAGDSIDQICRDVITAGTNVQYADGVANRAAIAAGNKIDRVEVKKAVRTLSNNNTLKLTSRLDPTNAYGTVPLNACFIGIISPSTFYDLDDAEGWVPVEKYSSRKDLMENEKGSLAGVRFVETTNAKTFASTVTVHATLIFGQHAYGITRLAGNALKNIVKPLGSAGTADPLDQRATSGWKATFVARILNDNFLVRIEHAVSS